MLSFHQEWLGAKKFRTHTKPEMSDILDLIRIYLRSRAGISVVSVCHTILAQT